MRRAVSGRYSSIRARCNGAHSRRSARDRTINDRIFPRKRLPRGAVFRRGPTVAAVTLINRDRTGAEEARTKRNPSFTAINIRAHPARCPRARSHTDAARERETSERRAKQKTEKHKSWSGMVATLYVGRTICFYCFESKRNDKSSRSREFDSE